MLSQMIEGHDHPIAYVSRSLNKNERNYSATEREALAVIFAVEKFQAYLGSRKFTIVTDHSSLKWFLNLENPSGRLARWGCRLSQFDFEIEHRKGTDNVVPDALSRLMKVEAIHATSDTPTSGMKDEWYERIKNNCVSKPTHFPNYMVKDNILFRLSKSKYDLISEFDWKEVIPKGLRNKIISENHCEPTAAHLGVFKTHRRLCLRYFWPGMYKDIENFVKSCDVCKAYKHSTQAVPGLMGKPKVCSRPFQVVSLDLAGPLPRSRSGYTYLLVITCVFSKYTLLFPLRRATSALVAKNFEDGLVLVHGAPETVILDNGTQMTGSEFRNVIKRYNVPRLHYTPRYTPQVNLVERYNKTIMTAVASYVEEDHRTWDLNLRKIQFAINSAINESTGFSPFFLVHAREPVINGDFYLDTQSEYKVAMPRDEYAGKFGCMEEIYDSVRKKLLEAHARNAQYYNRRRRNARFAVGDWVWKTTYTQSDAQKFKMAKLAPKYEKCKIVKVLSPLVYELERKDGTKIGSWHIKDLKR
ncbi:retrovirus-related Pol polyprotein from transposon 412 isoform X2 [Bicyclus anynana]|nr:retrovirus-related Pol polyprotein from transposon 412 isoform X1 [Bicyclus anynana]XP_052744718.1 retrovirus-related Pol polyprotein from transposon 412 isoform X2 [Bicyclus anynana]